MATITTSILTNSGIDMRRSDLVGFGSALSASSTNFSWFTNNAFGTTDVDIHGSGFAYSGRGDTRELSFGTISRISIDVGNDNASETSGDLVITGTEGLIVSSIDKDDPRGFWDEVLKGDDVFNLVGLAEADVGLRDNYIFGDDLRCPRTLSDFTDAGGNDTIFGADNIFGLTGDVFEVQGGSDGEFGIFVEYTGGNDTIVSAVRDRRVTIIGDADQVGLDATLNGGNDVLNNSNSTHIDSLTAGDAYWVAFFGTVNGGDDEITLSGGRGGAGDVYEFYDGTVNGGDDVIFANGAACAGDVAYTTTGASGTIRGGADWMGGSASADAMSGDVINVSTTIPPRLTVIGGNDTLSGGVGDDSLFGEAMSGDLSVVSGGNDRLFGRSGRDDLHGQTGNDRLNGGGSADILDGGEGIDVLIGGRGNDSLTGGAERDTFRFEPGAGVDRVLDFTDTNGSQDDRIDVRAYAFTRVGQIGKAASGDDLILTLGGDTVRIVDYLVDHTANQINDDILI